MSAFELALQALIPEKTQKEQVTHTHIGNCTTGKLYNGQ